MAHFFRFFEIYTIFTFSHRSERKISTNFADFFAKFLQNLQNFGKFARFWQKWWIFLKFWVRSGAKAWKSCRSRKMWKHAPFLAIVAVDTAENEPSKGVSLLGLGVPGALGRLREAELSRLHLASRGGDRPTSKKRTDAFICIFRDLQALQTFALLRIQKVQKVRNFFF